MSNEINPSQYFQYVKERQNIATDELLSKVYDNCLKLLSRYKLTGQKKAMQRLLFQLDCIEKEREIVKLGINRFVYLDDIEYYIEEVASDVVKIIELENYERNIPDEVIEQYSKVKDLFNKFYVIFTDYTGKIEKKVEKERREKDPILFGAFAKNPNRVSSDDLNERFYFIGDWVDEYCDLTLDKMVTEVEEISQKNILHPIKTPEDLEELKKQLNELEAKGDTWISVANIRSTINTSLTSSST